jgi:hypothetical protein
MFWNLLLCQLGRSSMISKRNRYAQTPFYIPIPSCLNCCTLCAGYSRHWARFNPWWCGFGCRLASILPVLLDPPSSFLGLRGRRHDGRREMERFEWFWNLEGTISSCLLCMLIMYIS